MNVLDDYPSTSLTVRRLHVDLTKGFARHWNGNDAFNTAFANAMSMSFPVGEQFFIDAVKAGLKNLPAGAENDFLHNDIRKFIGQEATHRHIHIAYNIQLEHQGYCNVWERRAAKRIQKVRHQIKAKYGQASFLHELAITCAVEHLTAILGDITLSRRGQQGDWFLNAVDPLKILWHWHAAEESEHKCVAFDLYTRLGGTYKWRMYWYRRVLFMFCFDLFAKLLPIK
jgi:predicted metal-dependent hydrolase